MNYLQNILSQLRSFIDRHFVCIEVDGVRVEGRITYRTNSAINVIITSPYQGAIDGAGRCPREPTTKENDFAGELGRKEAEKALLRSYHLLKFVYDNLQGLKIKIKKLDNAIANLDENAFMPPERFHLIRKELRDEVRCGKIENKAYQQQLSPEKKKVEARKYKIWDMEREFCKTNILGFTSHGQEVVLKIIRETITDV